MGRNMRGYKDVTTIDPPFIRSIDQCHFLDHPRRQSCLLVLPGQSHSQPFYIILPKEYDR